MDKPCYSDKERINNCATVLVCLTKSETGWENCTFGKLNPEYREKEEANSRKSRYIRAAILNEIYEAFDCDPDIMNKIEGLNLEEVIKNLLQGERDG